MSTPAATITSIGLSVLARSVVRSIEYLAAGLAGAIAALVVTGQGHLAGVRVTCAVTVALIAISAVFELSYAHADRIDLEDSVARVVRKALEDRQP